MAGKKLKPNIVRGKRAKGNPHQPAPRILENAPAKSVEKALGNSERQVKRAK